MDADVCVEQTREFFVHARKAGVDTTVAHVHAQNPVFHAQAGVLYEKIPVQDTAPFSVHASIRMHEADAWMQHARSPIEHARDIVAYAAIFIVDEKRAVQDVCVWIVDARTVELFGKLANVRDFFVRVLHARAIVGVVSFRVLPRTPNVHNAIATPASKHRCAHASAANAREDVSALRFEVADEGLMAQIVLSGTGRHDPHDRDELRLDRSGFSGYFAGVFLLPPGEETILGRA